MTLTELPRGVSLDGDGRLAVSAIACVPDRALSAPSPNAPALDPAAIRIVTWNLHKQEDAGWRDDLATFARAADVVLLQEAVMRTDLRATLEDAGLTYTMASAFIWRDADHGVLTASRVRPLALCAERAAEPLYAIPKTALIAWFALADRRETLAVVNLHAINFELTTTPYEAQLAALVRVLASHRGPIVFAGDFNTWSDARRAAMRAAGTALGLTEIPLDPDRRATFWGQQLDHVMLRGLDVVAARAVDVASSDHNPVFATLRAPPAPSVH